MASSILNFNGNTLVPTSCLRHSINYSATTTSSTHTLAFICCLFFLLPSNLSGVRGICKWRGTHTHTTHLSNKKKSVSLSCCSHFLRSAHTQQLIKFRRYTTTYYSDDGQYFQRVAINKRPINQERGMSSRRQQVIHFQSSSSPSKVRALA